MNKEYCTSCDKLKECFNNELGNPECDKCQESKNVAINAEMQKDRDNFNSLNAEQQAEIKSEYALYGVDDAAEWLGY